MDNQNSLSRVLTLDDLTEPIGKQRNSTFYNGKIQMYRCPECGHRALEFATVTEQYHCWACGIRGITPAGRELIRQQWLNEHPQAVITPKPAAPAGQKPAGQKPERRQPQPRFLPPVADNSAILPMLEDYVPLPDKELRQIHDISEEPGVTGDQKVVRDWLERQQIPLAVAREMRWGVASRKLHLRKGEKNGEKNANDEAQTCPCIVFRNYVEGYCCNAKFRSASDLKGFDQLSSVTPCAPYNIDALRPQPDQPGPRILFYTEGEKDTLTLHRLGFRPAIGAASGAQTNLERSFAAFARWLEPVEEVVIVGDMDQPGRLMTANAARFFGAKRVRVAAWDQRLWGKDITEVAQQHGDELAASLVMQAQPVPQPGIEDFSSPEAVAEALRSAMGQYDHGYSLGIGPLTDRHLRLTASQGGLIIATGVPGTGKTDFLNYLTMSVVNQKRSHVCFCSFETPNKYRHAGTLAQVWAGVSDLRDMQPDEARPFVETVMHHITHISFPTEPATPEAILQRADQVRLQHPDLELLIVDPYLYLELTEGRNITETSAIRLMLRTFQQWALRHRIWVVIVAHPRKLQKQDGSPELEEIDMYSIAGSANWANIADMIFSLRRIVSTEHGYDYTRLSVLKVRDQSVCTPGDVFYLRLPCGRYMECDSEADAKAHKANTGDVGAWGVES